MDRRNFFGYLAVVLLGISAAIGIYFFGFAPTVFRVAVLPSGSEPTEFFNAIAAALKRDGSMVRLRVIPYESNEAITRALENGHVDLAIARTDRPLPRGGLGVAQVQQMATFVFVRDGAGIASFADLKGHKVVEVGDKDASRGVFAELEKFNGLKAGDIDVKSLRSARDLANFNVQDVDALLMAVPKGAAVVSDVVLRLREVWGSAPVLVPLKEAKAIEARLPAFDSDEFTPGEVSAKPQIPGEATPTVAFPVLLVARQSLSSAAVQSLTREIFNVRNSLVSLYPAASRLAALETERGSNFAVHPGAAIYYDASETTFLDRYSDLLWLALFGFSSIVSAGVWFLQRLFPQQRLTLANEHDELIALLKEVRTTHSAVALDRASHRIDDIVADLSRLAFRGRLDESQKPAFDLLIERIESVIESRRAGLHD